MYIFIEPKSDHADVFLGQYFAADILERLWSWIGVEILKLRLFKILNFKLSGDADVLLMLSQDSEDEIRSIFVLELVEKEMTKGFWIWYARGRA